MKKVTYKNKFKDVDDALNKIPATLKENNSTFELTDGNKTIKVRWEGTLTEGVGIPLLVVDETLINEDITNMKRLMGYKSKDTIGTHTSSERLMENDKFKELLKSSKKTIINESEEILDEGLGSEIAKVLAILGLAVAPFQAMAQENPKRAADAVNVAINNASEQTLQNIEQSTGIDFHKETAERLFDLSKHDFSPKTAPELNMAGYLSTNGVDLIKTEQNNNGGFTYTVKLSGLYNSIESFTGVRNAIGKSNKKLANSKIQFVNDKGGHYEGKDINYK